MLPHFFFKENFIKSASGYNNNQQISKLMKAIKEEKDDEKIINLIEKEENINYVDNKYKINALLYAIKFKKSEKIIKLLIQKNININQIDKFNNSPLILAIRENSNKNIIKLLIKNSANINQRYLNLDLILREKFYLPFFLAIEKRMDLEIIKLLIDDKTDLKLKDETGKNFILMLIKKNYDFEYIKFLLEDEKFDINEEDFNGNTALILALENKVNNLDYIKLLFNNKTFLGQKNEKGKSPLIIGLEQKLNLDIIEFLFSKFNLDGNDIMKFDFISDKLIKDNKKHDLFNWRLDQYLIWKKKYGFFSYLKIFLFEK